MKAVAPELNIHSSKSSYISRGESRTELLKIAKTHVHELRLIVIS